MKVGAAVVLCAVLLLRCTGTTQRTADGGALTSEPPGTDGGSRKTGLGDGGDSGDAGAPDAGETLVEAFDAGIAHQVLALAGQKLLATASELTPTNSPTSTAPDGGWNTTTNTNLIGWTQGFFPGSLWYLHRVTGEPAYATPADAWTRALEQQEHNTETHDLGPKLFYSYGKAWENTGDAYYANVLLTGANSLATRYHANVGVISCCDWNPDWHLPLVIDTMLSLELLLWAADHGGDASLRAMAVSHALVTASTLIRDDGSTYQVADFDPDTGALLKKETYQGYANNSTWSRGQAWAIYGFTVMYRYTQDARMLAAARKVTDWYLAHLPADDVPNWDFDSPTQEKDSSAAAAVASGLLELSRLETDSANRVRYRAAALRMLASLSSPAYLAPADSTLGILLHGTGALPFNLDADTSLVYGDYYFIEALQRFAVP